jgi:hypothetical protein
LLASGIAELVDKPRGTVAGEAMVGERAESARKAVVG